MQLILDAADIDIKINMSAIEKESLDEKFLGNNIIEHLAEDITSGNKENIQKQDNIIPVTQEDNAVDASKEVSASSDLVLTNNLNGEISKEDEPSTEVSKTIQDKISESDSIKPNLESAHQDKIDENVLIEQCLVENKTLILPEQDNTPKEITLENKIPNEITDINQTTNEPFTNNEVDMTDISLDLNTHEQVNANKLVHANNMLDIATGHENIDENEKHESMDVSDKTEYKELDVDKKEESLEELDINEHAVSDSDKKSDHADVIVSAENKELDVDENIQNSHVSPTPNKQDAFEVDQELDIADLSSELTEEKKIDEEEKADKILEEHLEKESDQSVVPNTELDDKNTVMKISETASATLQDTCEKNTAIEINDEDENSVKKPDECSQQVQEIIEKVTDNTNEVKIIEEVKSSTKEEAINQKVTEEKSPPKLICRLSNNLDIFSDEEEDPRDAEPAKKDIQPSTVKQYINIDDDDDIMLIDEDTNTKDSKAKDSSIKADLNTLSNESPQESEGIATTEDVCMESAKVAETVGETLPSQKEVPPTLEPAQEITSAPGSEPSKPTVEKAAEPEQPKKPLLPKNFLNTCKKNLADMTRDDLEEFCILKIVESIVDRSSLGEIKTHLKNLTQTMEECKKKCLMLSKQNKDLQVVLKSVQEEQKSGSDVHITPLKITRSVGMQVVMVVDKNNLRKKPTNAVGSPAPVASKPAKAQQVQNTRNQKDRAPSNQIPVPRLVPAAPATKTNQAATTNTAAKQVNTSLPNGVRNSPPVQKVAEKRTRAQAVTVDLTDDEPPAKLPAVQRGVNQTVRVAPTAKTLSIPPQRFGSMINSPRKVYIPISGPQAQNNVAGRTLMLKTIPGMPPRPRGPAANLMPRVPPNAAPVQMGRVQPSRHPAPLPDAMKQYQPPNWKLLPPAPDLKLSKVENGIVISWKIDGYQEDNHEEIASYQLYAYQETTSPPSTTLWKKIGDVKALPLPMACTLTQFMAGYKYYFAVRAVDIRSRFGPFSLPGSILLLNKI